MRTNHFRASLSYHFEINMEWCRGYNDHFEHLKGVKSKDYKRQSNVMLKENQSYCTVCE